MRSARSQQDLDRTEPIELARVAGGVASAAGVTGGDTITVTTDLRPTAVVGGPLLIERLVANLIDNALRHNVEHGWVRVRTWATRWQAVLEITNSGPCIPPDTAATLFEPFR